jgi:hypothetical protein
MKLKMINILLSFFMLCYAQTYAQEACKVLKPEISGKYEGKCKNGLANGKGIATGTDKYEGDFKSGLPHGKGKYTWSTGEIYEGNWKEGNKEGDGKYYYKKDGIDSVRIGVWKDDVFYKVKVPAPYKVIRQLSISRYTVQRTMDGNKVLFLIQQNGSANSSVGELSFSPSSGTEFTLGLKQGFENVVFPFKCKLRYTTLNSFKTNAYPVEFEIEITQPGYWVITLNN